MAPANDVLQFLKWSPADGTSAAVNWRDYGRSRWQLRKETTPIAGVPGRAKRCQIWKLGFRGFVAGAQGRFWPDSAAALFPARSASWGGPVVG
jgi:hypothetical protein